MFIVVLCESPFVPFDDIVVLCESLFVPFDDIVVPCESLFVPFDDCIVCPSSIYVFLLPFWYLQNLRILAVTLFIMYVNQVFYDLL